MQVKTRMAPSPTGEYHIGHIRTLLYNYAFARKESGKFLIRIEDTDRERYVDGAVERILDVIEDYGFDWDEGPRVGGSCDSYIQSERLPIYKEKALELVSKGKAYYCFCTQERLKEMREMQQREGMPSTKYDRKCLQLTEKEVEKKLADNVPYVIRLKVPQGRIITYNDLVYGDMAVNSNDLDDQVLLKSDGFPTYHLGVVVDDHEMGVTHIMRGMDWLPSTPKHVLLYEAFGWEMPLHCHLPNLKELDGNRKLSKRFGSVFASDFLREGYLSEAVVNFLMFLGWNPGTEREIYSLEEFIKDFSVDRLQKTDLVSFDRKKLSWFNGQYIRALRTEVLLDRILIWADKYQVDLVSRDLDRGVILRVLDLVKDRLRVLSDFNDLALYFFTEPEIDKKLLCKFAKEKKAYEILEAFLDSFNKVADAGWTKENLENVCSLVLGIGEYKPKEAYMTLRVALTGREASPHIFDVLELLGKDVVLERITSALKH
ncbi:glutamate--tRNA ligase [Patescibacteria group bacterium]|nr:glutamate--tRNA ligase [Patescibacteria group bacterium]